MSTSSTGFDRDDRAVPATSEPALADALALLVALGWTQALFKVKEAGRVLGSSRATIYRDLAAGRLEAVKIGTVTRITAQSLARRIAELPPAQVRSA
jgi:excisionase family DNA binding protein